MGKRKEKKETYRERWLRKHRLVALYLGEDDYEFLKALADRSGKSYRELLLDALRGIKPNLNCEAERKIIDLRTLIINRVVLRCKDNIVIEFSESDYKKLREIIPLLPPI